MSSTPSGAAKHQYIMCTQHVHYHSLPMLHRTDDAGAVLQDGCAQTLSALAGQVCDVTSQSSSGLPATLLRLFRANHGHGIPANDDAMLVSSPSHLSRPQPRKRVAFFLLFQFA